MKAPGFDAFPLLPYRWSRRTYEETLHEARFSTVTWVHPRVSAGASAPTARPTGPTCLKIPHALYADRW